MSIVGGGHKGVGGGRKRGGRRRGVTILVRVTCMLLLFQQKESYVYATSFPTEGVGTKGCGVGGRGGKEEGGHHFGESYVYATFLPTEGGGEGREEGGHHICEIFVYVTFLPIEGGGQGERRRGVTILVRDLCMPLFCQ